MKCLGTMSVSTNLFEDNFCAARSDRFGCGRCFGSLFSMPFLSHLSCFFANLSQEKTGAYIYIYIYMWYMYFASLCFCLTLCIIPVVPHRAAAEVSKIGHYRRGDLLWCTDGRANPLMDVVGAVFFAVVAMVAVVTSPTTAGCSVA